MKRSIVGLVLVLAAWGCGPSAEGPDDGLTDGGAGGEETGGEPGDSSDDEAGPCETDDQCDDSGGPSMDPPAESGEEGEGGEESGTGGDPEPPPGACELLDKEDCGDGGERRCVYGEVIDDTWGVWTHCYQCYPYDTRQCGDESEWQSCLGNIQRETEPNDDPTMWGECWDLDEVECLPGSTDFCAGDRKATMWCRVGDDGLPYWDTSCGR